MIKFNYEGKANVPDVYVFEVGDPSQWIDCNDTAMETNTRTIFLNLI